MKYLAIIIFLLFPFRVEPKDSSIIVLVYHRFNNDKYPETSVSSEKFNQQIEYLVENNIPILQATDLVSYFNGEIELPKKSVFLTIDDAYKSFYEHAFPIVKKFNIPFSIFLSTDYVSNNKKSDHMSWEMLKDITRNNGLVLNHSKSHKSLIELNYDEVKKDIIENQLKIEQNLGSQPKIFSYPYGESNLKIESIVKELNYQIAFSQHSSPINKKLMKFRLPRFSINDEFGDLERFKLILKTKPMILSEKNFNDTLVFSESLKMSFKTKLSSKKINCFINNSALLQKENNLNNEFTLFIKNLRIGLRYRINCTHVDKDGDVFWFGKMIKRMS